MLSFLPGPVLAVASSVLLVLNLVFWVGLLMIVAIVKLIIPLRGWRRGCDKVLTEIATLWIDVNRMIANLYDIEWDIQGLDNLSLDSWYLVSSNHQNWIDVFALQYALNRRIPMLKFFIKRQLIWVPLLGFAWWALNMPFMHRHTREQIEKDPSLRQQDLDATRKACEHCKDTPTSIMNFLEGTRFTPAKHARQKSPYKHLLLPKAGGLAFVLASMGDTLTAVLDVTIAYPRPDNTFWELLTGRIKRIVLRVDEISIPAEMLAGDYLNDQRFRGQLQTWVNEMWHAKDARIEALSKGNNERRVSNDGRVTDID